MTQVKQENVLIYSKTHCPSCLKAKATFDKLNVPYTVKTLGVDMQPVSYTHLTLPTILLV